MTQDIQRTQKGADLWADLDRAFARMQGRCVDAWDVTPFVPTWSEGGELFRPARLDVTDVGSAFRVVAEIPGIPKERLDIRVRGSEVEIRGEQVEEKAEPGAGFVYRERRSAGFYRGLELPEPVVASDAKAKLENGVLELELPKQHPTPASPEVRVRVA